MDRLPAPADNWALFLDFDGTLVEIADRPEAVVLPHDLAGRLARLDRAFDGAVAIVSGRSLADLDAVLQPLRLPLAGLHGIERRDARGAVHGDADAGARLDGIREAVEGFAAARSGLLVEDKGSAIAIHYRAAPERREEVAAFLERQRRRLGNDFHVQAGKQVFELKPGGRDKGDAVRAFMDEPPFAGRIPVFVGDDRTDEDAFSAANALGGHSMRVGDHRDTTAAQCTLPSVAATLTWLDGLPDRLGDTAPQGPAEAP